MEDGVKLFIRLSDDPVEHEAALKIAQYTDPDAELSGGGSAGTVIIVHNDAAWTAVTMKVTTMPAKFPLKSKRG